MPFCVVIPLWQIYGSKISFANRVSLLNVGGAAYFWNSLDEKNYLMLAQIDFPVPDPLPGTDSPGDFRD